MDTSKGLRWIISAFVGVIAFFFLNFFFSMSQVLEHGAEGYFSSMTDLLWLKVLLSLLVGGLTFLLQLTGLNEIKAEQVGDSQHGSARWMTEKEKHQAYTYVADGHEKEPGIIVGRDGSRWMIDTTDKTICLVAPPGGGKTKSFFIPTLYYNAVVNRNTQGKGAGILSIDVKRENFASAGEELKRSGYRTPYLDFRYPQKSFHFNLMHGVNEEINQYKQTAEKKEQLVRYARAEKFAKQVSASIVQNVMGETRNSTSEFFDATAQGLVTGLILLVSQYGEESERHIISVFKLIVELNGLIDNGNLETGKQVSKLTQLLEYIDDKRISDYVGASVNADVRTAMNIFSSALAKLVDFIDAELEQMVCDHSPEINVEDFIQHPTAIFIICPDEDNSRHFFASLFVRYFTTQLINMAESRPEQTLPRKVLCLWDEFGNMPAIKDVDALFTAARSRGIRILYSLQSFGQLEKNYNRTYAEIIEDASQILIFTFLSPTATKTAEKLSTILGNQTVLSGSVSRGESQGRENASATYTMIKRPLMEPDEIISIPIGTYIVVKAGSASGQTKMKSRLPVYSDYLPVNAPYNFTVSFDYRAIDYLTWEKIRRHRIRQESKLTVGMFD